MQLRYTDDRVAARLRIWHISAITFPQYPVYYERLRAQPDSLSILILLFLLQAEVELKTAESVLNNNLLQQLLKRGLLVKGKTGKVASTVSIYPCRGFYFVTDHHFRPPSVRPRTAPRQPVMHFGNDTYILGYLVPKLPIGSRVLDLCTGSGVHAILAAAQAPSSRATGVDLNPRAIEFAKLNATINAVGSRCDFRYGSLYEPLLLGANGEEHERFDLIVANPPFTPSPRVGIARVLFQDAGPTGDEIVGSLLNGLVERLKPNGVGVVLSMFADQKRRRHEAKIRRWIGSRTPVDLLWLKIYSIDPEELVSVLAWQLFEDDFADYSKRYREWLGELNSMEVTNLTYGLLVVRPSDASSFRTGILPLAKALDLKNAAQQRQRIYQTS
jgi:carbamoyltransferase